MTRLKEFFQNIISPLSGRSEGFPYALAFTGIGLVYALNLFLDVMDVDAAQYASISMEMLAKKNFLQVFHRGADYLDKPPLLFWMSSLSFSLMGLSNAAYKLPSVLILVLGIYSTYRFALMHYSKETARMAAMILASSQALLLITNDVRTDCSLTGWVIFAVWQISAFISKKSIVNLLLGAAGTGFAMLAKGPVGMFIPVMSVFLPLVIRKEWKILFRPQWLLAVSVLAAMLFPMCLGLYRQFDLHPEKVVDGVQGPSGLRFYFWTQSFGRITGESSWKNNTGFFYFFKTILWDFQPWVFLFAGGLFFQLRSILRRDDFRLPELTSLLGFSTGFLALSASHYKLPHYIFPLLPFAAILTAHFLAVAAGKGPAWRRWMSGVQIFVACILYLATAVCNALVFPGAGILLWLLWALSVALHIRWSFFSGGPSLKHLAAVSVLSFVAFGVNMSTWFYPRLLHYQSGSQAGKFITERKVPEDMFYWYRTRSHSLDFYSGRIVPEIKSDSLGNLPPHGHVFTDREGAVEIISKNPAFSIIRTFEHFDVTRLNIRFLNPATREASLRRNFILERMR